MGKPDDNHVYVTMAVTDDANATPTPLSIDDATGRILCTIVNESRSASVVTHTFPDDNHVPIATITDSSGNIYPLHISTDGYILADVVIE